MSGSPKKGSSGCRGSQYRRVCRNKSLITLRDGDNVGEGWHGQKPHAYGVYGGRLVFLPAHLGETIWNRNLVGIAGRNGMGLSHLRGLRTRWESSP